MIATPVAELDDGSGWDDQERVTLEPFTDLETSGDTWVWVPAWDVQNEFGADRKRWEDACPPLTLQLREKLDPVEVAYYDGRQDTMQSMITHASRKIGWQPSVGGWTPEDIAADAMSVVYPLGFDVGGPSWVKMTRRVMNRKVADLLRAQTSRQNTVVESYSHDQSEALDFVSQVFSEDTVMRIAESCSVSEAMALIYMYQNDWSSEQVAEEMCISPSTVRTLVERGKSKLRL